MNQMKIQALADMLDGVPPAKLKALIAGHTTKATQKAAELGMRYKAPEPLYRLPDGRRAVLRAGQLYAVKADPMATTATAADMPMDDLTALVRQLVQEALAEMKAAPAGQDLPTGLTTVKARRPFTSQFDAIATELGLPDW